MKIAVDIDGVLCDHIPPIMDWVNKKYGTEFTKIDVNVWKKVFKAPDAEIHLEDVIHEVYRDGEFLLTFPAMRGAREGMERLAKHHDVQIVTTRPFTLDQASTKWVARNIGGYEIWYVDLKDDFEADIMIDDYPVNIDGFMGYWNTMGKKKRAYLFSQPWNEDYVPGEHVEVVLSWEHLLWEINRLK